MGPSLLTVAQFIPELMELHRSGNFPIERLCKNYHMDNLEMALTDLESGSVRWQTDIGSAIPG